MAERITLGIFCFFFTFMISAQNNTPVRIIFVENLSIKGICTYDFDLSKDSVSVNFENAQQKLLFSHQLAIYNRKNIDAFLSEISQINNFYKLASDKRLLNIKSQNERNLYSSLRFAITVFYNDGSQKKISVESMDSNKFYKKIWSLTNFYREMRRYTYDRNGEGCNKYLFVDGLKQNYKKGEYLTLTIKSFSEDSLVLGNICLLKINNKEIVGDDIIDIVTNQCLIDNPEISTSQIILGKHDSTTIEWNSKKVSKKCFNYKNQKGYYYIHFNVNIGNKKVSYFNSDIFKIK
jgi:hypothetical protein